MFQLIYVSTSVRDMSKEELLTLLDHSVENNKKNNLTGMLLYGGGNFIQIIEGEKNKVKSLYEIIKQDNRHRGCITLVSKEVEERLFPGWSMGFKYLTENDKNEIEGFTEFLDRKMEPIEFANRSDDILNLLYSFRKYNR